jgi:hypothetical protein
LEPGSQEEEIILKDKFLMQAAPDIHRKFQKLEAEGSRDLDQLVQPYFIRGTWKRRKERINDWKH